MMKTTCSLDPCLINHLHHNHQEVDVRQITSKYRNHIQSAASESTFQNVENAFEMNNNKVIKLQ